MRLKLAKPFSPATRFPSKTKALEREPGHSAPAF
jgi:hypothetical protein